MRTTSGSGTFSTQPQQRHTWLGGPGRGDICSGLGLDERLMRGATAVSHTIPPQEPGRHGWADVLRLIDELTQLAFDKVD
jgi:hypothetical protein